MNDKIDPMLSGEELKRLAFCETGIQKGIDIYEKGLHGRIEAGQLLLEIRDKRLYRATHGNSFERYCQDKWGWVRRHVNQIIAASKVASNLGTNVPKNISEGQLRPLSSLPPPRQKKAFKQAVETAEKEGKPLTAKRVEQAVRDTEPPARKVLDEIGREIPKHAIELWHRRDETQELLAAVQKVKASLKKAEDDGDPIYRGFPFQQVKVHLDSVYHELKFCRPYAVCGKCQGHKCKLCHDTGLMNKLQWEQLIPKETREIIERKAGKK